MKKKKALFAFVLMAVTVAFPAEPIAVGTGFLNNRTFHWTAMEAKTGLVEIVFDKAVSLHEVQLQFFWRLPTERIKAADNIVTGELTKLTLEVSGNLEEALQQAARAVPGLLQLRVTKKEKVDNPERIVAEHR